MPTTRPPAAPIAVLVDHLPPGLTGTPGVIWCRTGSELIVLAQRRRVRAAVVDSRLGCVDRDLIGAVRGSPAVVIDGGSAGPDWEALGATVCPALPTEPAELLAIVTAAEVAAPNARQTGWPRSDPSPGQRAPVVAVIGAPGGDGARGAATIARSLTATDPDPRSTVLADLSLDAPQRMLHGLDDRDGGLLEVVAASRFGPPPATVLDDALHPVEAGYLVLPGVRRHRDWVSLGRVSTVAAVEALRARTGIVVAQIDGDLEGEADTGSFDIEDRNVLTRSTVQAACLVVVVGGSTEAIAAIAARLHQFGVAPEHVLPAVPAPRHRHDAPTGALRLPMGPPAARADGRWTARFDRRPHRHLGMVLRARLGDAHRPTSGRDEPEQVIPGTLGHWVHDDAGCTTPSTPQQP